MPNPNNVSYLMDGAWFHLVPTNNDVPPPEYEGYDLVGGTGNICYYTMDRHLGSINGIFFDFSARSVGLKELWTLKHMKNFNTQGVWTLAGGATTNQWPEWMRHYTAY